MEPFSSLIGHRLKVVLTTDEVFSADLFAYDAEAKLLVFRLQHVHTFQKADYRIVAERFVAHTPEDLGLSPDTMPPLREVREEDMRRREEAAVAREMERLSTRGVGVTPKAQFVFDSVHKSMRCRWEGSNIVVAEAVVVQTALPGFPVAFVKHKNQDVHGGTRDAITKRVARCLEEFEKRAAGGSTASVGGGEDGSPVIAAPAAQLPGDSAGLTGGGSSGGTGGPRPAPAWSREARASGRGGR